MNTAYNKQDDKQDSGGARATVKGEVEDTEDISGDLLECPNCGHAFAPPNEESPGATNASQELDSNDDDGIVSEQSRVIRAKSKVAARMKAIAKRDGDCK